MRFKEIFLENKDRRYCNITKVKKENMTLVIDPIRKIKENSDNPTGLAGKLANCSSKSKSSKFGTGKSLMIGSNTANWRGGRGVSNWGGMMERVSCLTFNLS